MCCGPCARWTGRPVSRAGVCAERAPGPGQGGRAGLSRRGPVAPACLQRSLRGRISGKASALCQSSSALSEGFSFAVFLKDDKTW